MRRPSKACGVGLIMQGCFAVSAAAGCDVETSESPTLSWYVFDEATGTFAAAARRCAEESGGAYRVRIVPLPSDADQQREQLVRRLAAGDRTIDLIGMDVIWTPEFAAAGWIMPWPEDEAQHARAGRLGSAVQSATYQERLWAVPFTTNTQLLWYRKDRVARPPATWDEMLGMAEALGDQGIIQVQGERYEGLTVFFMSLLASAGGSVLDPAGEGVALAPDATRTALSVMRRLATSQVADPALDITRENEARLAFETGSSSFMLNYTFVWATAREVAPEIAENVAWARWPAVVPGRASHVTIGGINLGVGAFSRHPDLARRAAACIASERHQRAAVAGCGLPPTMVALYDDPDVQAVFPFADLLRETLNDAIQRPRTPMYNDVSLAISRTLHPMAEIEEDEHLSRLHETVGRALRSEGLL